MCATNGIQNTSRLSKVYNLLCVLYFFFCFIKPSRDERRQQKRSRATIKCVHVTGLSPFPPRTTWVFLLRILYFLSLPSTAGQLSSYESLARSKRNFITIAKKYPPLPLCLKYNCQSIAYTDIHTRQSNTPMYMYILARTSASVFVVSVSVFLFNYFCAASGRGTLCSTSHNFLVTGWHSRATNFGIT